MGMIPNRGPTDMRPKPTPAPSAAPSSGGPQRGRRGNGPRASDPNAPAPMFPGSPGRTTSSKTQDNSDLYPQIEESQERLDALDLNSPGWGEQYWAANQDWNQGNYLQDAQQQYGDLFSEPTAIEDYWGSVSGTPSENRSDYEYDNFDASEPDFDAYYDNAYSRSADRLNQEMAARGQYGASQTGQALTDLGVGIEAERANRRADFMAGRQDARGRLAGQADQVDLSNLMGRGQLAGTASLSKLNRGQAGMSFANMLDAGERADLGAGMGAASVAQGLKEGRVRGGYQDMLAMAQATSPLAAGSFDDMFSSDSALLEQQIAMLLGIPREELNQVLAHRQEGREGLGAVANMVGSVWGMGGGGGK